MPLNIRPFVPDDYPAVVALKNAAHPDYQFTVDEFRARNAQRPAFICHARFVAEEASRIVGCGEYDQRADMYHPGKFLIGVDVPPGASWERTATALYATLVASLAGRPLVALRTFADETRPNEVAFWRGYGFSEAMRDGGATLSLAGFDFGPFAEVEVAVRAQGITIRTMAELADDPDRNARLCDLQNALLADVPPRDERTPMDLETFVRLRLGRPDLLPDGHFIARAPDGSYIGVSTVNRSPNRDPRVLATGLTGVLPAWRRRGIALALKLRAIRYAVETGAERLTTHNASSNDPILDLNRRLGFTREPWRLHMVKNFGEMNA